ncbi:hypothetical protein DUI87_16359 [Hirundo rustica rustica]|uniref:Uncharacterized protein n=1 Tax=Hirundo rustica rustica TaxID=333673 RepID=A0A3M0K0V7_HIRRU|nr:hypothetical protein DUI87_16359 [Hirundo rustica rustica]
MWKYLMSFVFSSKLHDQILGVILVNLIQGRLAQTDVKNKEDQKTWFTTEYHVVHATSKNREEEEEEERRRKKKKKKEEEKKKKKKKRRRRRRRRKKKKKKEEEEKKKKKKRKKKKFETKYFSNASQRGWHRKA